MRGWFKPKYGKAWHMIWGTVLCGRSFSEGSILRHFPARDGKICQGCLHRLAEDKPEDLIGHSWFDQPTEAEIIEEEG